MFEDKDYCQIALTTSQLRDYHMTLFVNTKDKTLHIHTDHYPCRIGMNGAICQSEGREGDGKTPLGAYKLRFGLYRPDRVPPPPSKLTFWPLKPDDGWCDDPAHPAYNRFIKRPFSASHESLWREDGAYDIILVTSHNDSPPQLGPDKTGLGSAVFIHIAQYDDRQTLGCIAVTPDIMAALLPRMFTGQDVIFGP